MSKYLVATKGDWNIQKYKDCFSQNEDFKLLTDKNELTFENLSAINPEVIFFPHWSHIIPEMIFSTFNCVVFHMTDLPYGRGGSPLQNLILRGVEKTKISAIKVTKGIDEGPIYFKDDLSLEGTALEIFERFSNIVFEKMIPKFISEDITPTPQEGEPVNFKRRVPQDGDISSLDSLSKVYDFIRMLDAPGYPNAFLETPHFTLNFSSAKIGDDSIEAKVTFKRKNSERDNRN